MSNGADLAINSTGPLLRPPAHGSADTFDGPAKAFYDAERKAVESDTPENAKIMYERGYGLVYFNCNQYFDSAGKNQTVLIATRDAVGAIGAVSTSVLVLAKGSKSALAAVGIATGGAYAGIDTYTKDFLFSAENVDAVRSLVTSALDTHHKAVLASFGDANAQVTYDVVSVQLRDEQTICTLRHIAALATEAIKNGHLVATTNTVDGDIAGLAKIQDQAVLSALGTILQTSGALVPSEAGALWEIVHDGTKDRARLKTLEGMLARIPDATNPFDPTNPGTGTLRTGWVQQASVDSALQGFSDTTKAAFEAQVIASKDQQNRAQLTANTLVKANAPPVPVAPIPFQLGTGSSGALTGRIDVRAR